MLSALVTSLRLIYDKGHSFVLALSWMATLGLFLWIASPNLYAYMLSNSRLAVLEKISFVLSVYPNFFNTLSSPLSVSILILTFVAALNFVIIFEVSRVNRSRRAARQGGGAVTAMLVSHGLSCGSSLLVAPLVTALAGSGNYFSGSRSLVAQTLGLLVNIVAILILARSLRKIAGELTVLQTV